MKRYNENDILAYVSVSRILLLVDLHILLNRDRRYKLLCKRPGHLTEHREDET